MDQIVDGFTDGATVVVNGKPVAVGERERLRDAVVEAATKRRRMARDPKETVFAVGRAWAAEDAAVDALIEFESQEIGNV